MHWLAKAGAWLASEYLHDYRESRARVFDVVIKNNPHLNTVILTVSVASLTAIATLSDRAFTAYPWLSIFAIGLFILTILFSTINFFLSGLALSDLQQKLNEDVLFPFQVNKGKYSPRFKKTQKILNMIVLFGFCLGLIALLVLLGSYILGGVNNER